MAKGDQLRITDYMHLFSSESALPLPSSLESSTRSTYKCSECLSLHIKYFEKIPKKDWLDNHPARKLQFWVLNCQVTNKPYWHLRAHRHLLYRKDCTLHCYSGKNACAGSKSSLNHLTIAFQRSPTQSSGCKWKEVSSKGEWERERKKRKRRNIQLPTASCSRQASNSYSYSIIVEAKPSTSIDDTLVVPVWLDSSSGISTAAAIRLNEISCLHTVRSSWNNITSPWYR